MKAFFLVLAIATVAAAQLIVPKTDDIENISDHDGKVCEPGKNYYEYCNICRCSNDGKHGACTKMACNQNVFNKDGSLKKPYKDLIRPKF